MFGGVFTLSRAQKPNTGRSRTRNPITGDHTEFYGSQVGGKSVINYGYTDMPLKLLMWDMRTFFTFAYALPWVVWPLKPSEDSGEFAELSLTRGNVFCLLMHVCVLLPVWIAALGIAGFFGVNWLVVLTLNGSSPTYTSDPKYAPALPEHAHEKWIFINGVAAGETWMLSNLNRLALTFKRPILGIHNKTTGIIFDVVECLIQRNFGYATVDVRDAYKEVKEHLYNPGLSKVVFILHSQGGIEGSMVLDWLLQELPQNLLAKLEVYTFGNAANHFNNPHRHVESQKAEQNDPSSMNIVKTPVTEAALTDSPIELKAPALSKQSSAGTRAASNTKHAPPTPPNLETEEHRARVSVVPAADRAIGHIEHYAHTTDFVALWGVLHFVTNEMANPLLPRFIGRVFSRTSSRGGHQLVQHYLDGMFPLEKNAKGEFIGCKDSNEFMDSIVEHAQGGTERDDVREGIENSWALIGGDHDSGATPEVEVRGSFREGKHHKGEMRVKDLSRLWLYRNGRSPPEMPKSLPPDSDGVVRAGTL
ncbi:hypothetical protein TruAng_012146 [Truncatella angustata]|nr:hypothetical protein TruAng_012146 [Truncatella angustata]